MRSTFPSRSFSQAISETFQGRKSKFQSFLPLSILKLARQKVLNENESQFWSAYI
jgi:hypothetical protein